MTARPPLLAMWLLTHAVSVPNADAVLGDLLEQYSAGRSAIWFWRQTATTVLLSAGAAAWTHRWMALAVIVVNQMLPGLYMRVVSHWTAIVFMAWYPRAWNWLAASAPDPIWRTAVWLHPWEWTGAIAWCGVLALVVWAFALARPANRHFIAAMFIVLNVIRCLPFVVGRFADFDPASALWTSNFIWHTTYEFVVVPASILFGASALPMPRRAIAAVR